MPTKDISFQGQFWDMGSSINHVVKILGIFDPPPPLWSLLLNKAYVIKWSSPPSTAHVVYE